MFCLVYIFRRVTRLFPNINSISRQGKKETHQDSDVVLGTVGTLYRVADKLGKFDLILVDECHLVNLKAVGMYRKMIEILRKASPHLRPIGWTGTAFRGNGVWLTDGDDRLFTDIAARLPMRELLDDGALSPLVNAQAGLTISSEGLDTDSNGDFKVCQVAAKIDQPGITETIADEIVRLGEGRKTWIVYCVTVAHAEHMTTALFNRGVSVACVHQGTPKSERQEAIQGARDGTIKCLVNVACLTTGLDIPEIDLIALARNTKSPVLYTQIGGRGMRVAPGKENCLWLDFTDTTSQMGPIDAIRGRAAPKKNERLAGVKPYKLCSNCGASSPTGSLTCHACGQLFPPQVSSVYTMTSNAPVLSDGQPVIKTYAIDSVTCVAKTAKSGNKYLQVQYWSGISLFTKSLMLGHSTAGKKAMKEFQQMTTVYSVAADPDTAYRLIQSGAVQFRPVKTIDVDTASKYQEIKGVRYA